MLQRVLFLLISLFFFSYVFASEDNTLDLAKEILKLNQNSANYNTKKQVLEKFADLKEYVQTDLKNGNKLARVDIFLLLDGLVQDNIYSLQSYLATNNEELFANEFSDSINYDYAEKLSYALKENKHLLTTEYIVEEPKDFKNCKSYVNGTKITNNKTFYAPAGLPYYVASYCDGGKFALAKVHSETVQAKYVVHLSQYRKTYNEEDNALKNDSNYIESEINKINANDDIDSAIENYKNDISSNETNNQQTNIQKDEDFGKLFLSGGGIYYDFYSGLVNKFELICPGSSSHGECLSYDLFLQKKYLVVGINYTPLKRVAQITSEIHVYKNDAGEENIVDIPIFENQNGYLFRTYLGIKKEFLKENTFSFSLFPFINNTFFSV